ncbi:hypothetical protein [Evansella clarkii]|uniref:hypothetical protein n=1 Tax=Evansella clarkii TaxID=79879 RepID=UPI000B44B10E|nr:hypothetical protein [Evansella clarkii]
MNYLIDESIFLHLDGFSWNEGRQISVREDRTAESNSLSSIIAGYQGSVFPRPFKFRKLTTQEELQYFTEYFKEQAVKGPVVYIYDPAVTGAEKLLRIRNWLLPEYRLIPVAVREGFEAMDAVNITQYLGTLAADLGAENITSKGTAEYLNKHLYSSKAWLIIPYKKITVYEKKRKTMQKDKQFKTFYIHEYTPETGSWKVAGKGKISDLCEEVLNNNRDNDFAAVCKGCELENKANVKNSITVPNSNLPVNVPFVQLLPLKMNITEAQQVKNCSLAE